MQGKSLSLGIVAFLIAGMQAFGQAPGYAPPTYYTPQTLPQGPPPSVHAPQPHYPAPTHLPQAPHPAPQAAPYPVSPPPGAAVAVPNQPVPQACPAPCQPGYCGNWGSVGCQSCQPCPPVVPYHVLEGRTTCVPCFWARVEYLHWWFKDATTPPLVTTNINNEPPTLDRAGTVTLFGGNITGQDRPGGRVTMGIGLPIHDGEQTWGVEVSFFYTSPRSTTFAASSGGLPVLGRPFADISTGTLIPFVEAVANPAGVFQALSGTVAVDTGSRLYGGDANVVCPCCDPCQGWFFDFLFGYRFVGFNENLTITENLAAQDGTGELIQVRDAFSTRNTFHGAQLGMRVEKDFGRVFVQATGKAAVGALLQSAIVEGATRDTLPPNAPAVALGGLLAQQSNIGRYDSTAFSYVGEGELRAGYHIAEGVRFYAGYTFLYLGRVARPGNLIDPVVNTAQLPQFINGVPQPTPLVNPARPAFSFNRTDFWAHGALAGFEVLF